MRRFTSSDLLGMKWVSDPQISPDGKSVLFTVKSVVEEDKVKKYKTSIHIARDGRVAQFTSGPKNDTSPRWSPRGDRVVFLSERSKDRTQMFLISMAGGEAVQLTTRKDGVGEPQWSPDGKMIAFAGLEPAADAKDCDEDKEAAKEEKSGVRVITNIRYKMNGRGFLPDRRSQIFVLDVESKVLTQVTKGEYDCREPEWSPDGKLLAFTSARFEGHEFTSVRDIYVVPSEGGEMRKVTNTDTTLGGPSWSPDGKWIAFFGHDNQYKGSTVAGVCVVSAEGGPVKFLTKQSELAVGQSAGGDMSGSPGTRPTWSADSAVLFFSALDFGKTHIYKVDSSTGAITQLTKGNCLVAGWTKSVANDTFAVHYQSPSLIGDMVVLDPLCGQGCGCGLPTTSAWTAFAEVGDDFKPFGLTAEGFTIRRLTRVNDELLSSVYLSISEEFEAVSPDGTKVQAWIMKPVAMKDGAKYPLALEIHGGPHSAYGFAFSHEFQLLANRGYGVAFSNPRGSVGHGQKAMIAIRHDWGGVDYQDIMAALDHAVTFPWVDTGRLGVLGGSYGGYMTNWAVTHTDRFQAAVTVRSTCNRMSQFGASDMAFMNGSFEFDGDPWDNPKAYLDVSPLMYVRNVKTPIMVIHSEQDLRCPIEQGEEWFTALKKTGKKAIMVRFPNENHELSRSGQPQHRIERLEYILAWFDKFIAPKDGDYSSPIERPEKPIVKLPEKI